MFLLPSVAFLADTEEARLRTSPSTAALPRRNSHCIFQHIIIFFYFFLFPTDLDRVERRLGQLMLGRTDWSVTQVSRYIPGTRGGDHKTR